MTVSIQSKELDPKIADDAGYYLYTLTNFWGHPNSYQNILYMILE